MATSEARAQRGRPALLGPGEVRVLARHALLVFLGAAMLFPFLWMLGTSLKPQSEIYDLSLLPREPQPENYAVVLRLAPDPYTKRFLDLSFPVWYFNSLFVAAWVTTLQVLTSALAAYAFSRLHWPGRDLVFRLYLATMMVSGIVLVIPNYRIMVGLGLVNSYAGLILPGAFSAFGTFLLRQFMLSIPRSLDDAARIDGAGHVQIFTEVVLPLSRPGLVTLAVFTYLGNFQSFFWPLVMVRDDRLRTLPVGLLAFKGDYGQQTELMMAATVMYVVPLIALFVLLQRRIVAGIQLGGLKG